MTPHDLIEAVRGLTPNWQSPERFHEAKSLIVDGLRRLPPGPCPS